MFAEWIELCPSKIPFKSSNLNTCERDLIWKWGLCKCSQVKNLEGYPEFEMGAKFNC